MGLSIWHVLILLLIVGVPIAMYFVVSGDSKAGLHRAVQFFHCSFWIQVVSTVGIFSIVLARQDPESLSIALGILGLALTLAWWTYLIALAVLAKRTGRIWVLWAGLTFIGSLVGPLVSYPLMIGALKKKSADAV